MLTRRTFLQTTTAAAAIAAPQATPKRLAVILAGYTLQSPAQQMTDRFLVGYPYAGAWHKPEMRVASLYVDQKPAGDLSAARAGEFGFQVYPGVAEALRSGGKELAVDGVMVFPGEGGDLLDQCVQLFEQDRRAVPVFHYGSLSPSFDKAKRIVDASRRLRFPILAGSSLPVTWRLPAIDLPLGCDVESAVIVGVGDRGFEALEALAAMLERRRGGETGVKAVQFIEGDAVWKSAYPKELLSSALSRSDTPLGLTELDGRTQDLVASGELQKLAKNPAAYVIEYADGVKATMLMLSGAVKDFNFAARLKGGRIWSTQFLLTPDPNATHNACLTHYAEQMFETAAAPWPVDRALLVSGILESCLESKGQRLATPHLNVKYQPPRESQFARV